jgi:hypothetical protein
MSPGGTSNASGATMSTPEVSLSAEQQHALLLEQLRVQSEHESRVSSASGHKAPPDARVQLPQPLRLLFLPPPPAVVAGAAADTACDTPEDSLVAPDATGADENQEGEETAAEKRERKCCALQLEREPNARIASSLLHWTR